MDETKRPEVLSPAGDREKLKMAVAYGADAVYLAGPGYGMRAGAGVFGPDDMAWAMGYCHARGVKVYVTVNTIPTDEQTDALPGYLESLEAAHADGLIVSDLGVLALAKRYAPHAAVHISTQAGVMNAGAARMFYDLGAARVVLAREMSLAQIAELRARAPKELELEAFCHGAMCVSFSGRCVISDYLTGRAANQGACAQPCRWRYKLMEEKRPGELFDVTEDGGTYLYNSRDMCMIDHVPEPIPPAFTSARRGSIPTTPATSPGMTWQRWWRAATSGAMQRSPSETASAPETNWSCSCPAGSRSHSQRGRCGTPRASLWPRPAIPRWNCI